MDQTAESIHFFLKFIEGKSGENLNNGQLHIFFEKRNIAWLAAASINAHNLPFAAFAVF
jgi:hypothetical protein